MEKEKRINELISLINKSIDELEKMEVYSIFYTMDAEYMVSEFYYDKIDKTIHIA